MMYHDIFTHFVDIKHGDDAVKECIKIIKQVHHLQGALLEDRAVNPRHGQLISMFGLLVPTNDIAEVYCD